MSSTRLESETQKARRGSNLWEPCSILAKTEFWNSLKWRMSIRAPLAVGSYGRLTEIRAGHRLPTTWSDEWISHSEKRPDRCRPQRQGRVDARQGRGTRAALDRARRQRARRFSMSRSCPERRRSTRYAADRECFATRHNGDFLDDRGSPTLHRQAREQASKVCCRAFRNKRRNSRLSTSTGRKKFGREEIQRVPSGERPPPATTICKCGWCVRV